MNFGDLKITTGESGSGGHNGVQSIFNHTKIKDFNRVKIGIIPKKFLLGFQKPNKSDVASFVLKKFSKGEQTKIEFVFGKVEEKVK